MRASSGVSSLSEGFRSRRVGVPDVEVRSQPVRGRRVGLVSSVALVAGAIWIGWLVGSGRLPSALAALQSLLPWS